MARWSLWLIAGVKQLVNAAAEIKTAALAAKIAQDVQIDEI